MADLTIAEGLEYFKGKENAFIATVETGTSATRAYEVGDYFWKGGKLYEATAPIASGTAFTVGTNCKLAVIGDDVSDLKESINNLNWNKASAIHGNASGEIASFNDGSNNAPIKITNMSDSATKIFAFGYNLLLNEAESGKFGNTDITINDDGTFTVTNKTGNAWDGFTLNTTPILLKAGTYTIAEYDGAQANGNSALNVISNGAAIFNTRYTKVANLVLSEDTEITVTFSVAYARINKPTYALIVKGSVGETGITYNNIPQIYKKSVGTIAPPNTEIFSQDGINNIWADNGQISVEYVVNTKMYIDNKITELQATLLENIGG